MDVNTTSANDGIPYRPDDLALLFTSFYIIGGIVVVGACLGLIFSSLETSSSSRYPLLVSASMCAVCLLAGAAIGSAVEGYDFVHGLYWATVTMSTVGYGSGTPHTEGGRLFTTAFMLVGVGLMGNFVSELSGRLGLPGWPGVAEEVIVARDVMLARHTGSRVHVAHASTAGTVEVLRWARSQGIAVTAEVTPHHLLLTTDLLGDYDPTYKVNPPLRPAEDVEALRAALADGTIDAVATDHAPHARLTAIDRNPRKSTAVVVGPGTKLLVLPLESWAACAMAVPDIKRRLGRCNMELG